MESFVDPAVSRAKFDRELSEYRKLEDDHLKRGWWLLKAAFPEVFVVFATARLRPPAVIMGVLLDFTDYDFLPPSVRIVNPFTRIPFKTNELPVLLKQTVLQPGPQGFQGQFALEQPLMQGLPEEIPFLCLPGVREYHKHPAHTGDLWELRRGKGEGTLFFLLDQIHKYGVQPISGYQIGLTVLGFHQQNSPQ